MDSGCALRPGMTGTMSDADFVSFPRAGYLIAYAHGKAHFFP